MAHGPEEPHGTQGVGVGEVVTGIRSGEGPREVFATALSENCASPTRGAVVRAWTTRVVGLGPFANHARIGGVPRIDKLLALATGERRVTRHQSLVRGDIGETPEEPMTSGGGLLHALDHRRGVGLGCVHRDRWDRGLGTRPPLQLPAGCSHPCLRSDAVVEQRLAQASVEGVACEAGVLRLGHRCLDTRGRIRRGCGDGRHRESCSAHRCRGDGDGNSPHAHLLHLAVPTLHRDEALGEHPPAPDAPLGE